MSSVNKFTGLNDSNGLPINIGSQVKCPAEINQDVHGDWVVYNIIAKGIIPFVKYSHSETGQAIPGGMGEMPLTDFYDRNELCHTGNISTLLPDDEIVVITTQETLNG